MKDKIKKTAAPNLPKGYKKTEIGVIPEDWEVEMINNFSRPVRGGSPRPAGSPLYFYGNFIPWLTVASITNIPNSQLIVNQTETCLTEEGSKHSRILEKNTIIIANSGATLGVAKLLGVRCCANDGIAALLDINKEIDGKYLVYYINTLTKSLRERIATGNGQPNLNTELIGNIQIPLPPLPEQEAIATVLSDTDKLIQAFEKKIAKKQLIKKGAMQRLLTPKEGWITKRLGDFLIYEQPTNYIVKSTKYHDNYDIPVLTAGKSFILGYTNEKDGIFTSYPVIIFDDFTTASKYVNFSFKVKSSAMKILKSKNEDVNLRFVYEIMQQIEFPLGDHKRHWIGEFQTLEIRVPKSIEEQTRIAQILSDMDSEIEALEKKLAKYKQIKQGLMQVLLTGKIRLV